MKKLFIFIITFISLLMNNAALDGCYQVDLRIDDIEPYTGPNITFNPEHNPEEVNFNQVSFPISWCYPVAITATGNTRWFFTSAIEGPIPYLGEAVTITNHALTDIFVVRGKAHNGNWFHVYFGLDSCNPKFFNNAHTVYQGNIIYLLCKDPSRLLDNNHCYIDNAKYLDSTTIKAEIKKYLPNPQDWHCESQAFQHVLKSLFLQKNDSFYFNGRLFSSLYFWASRRNYI